MNEMERGDNEFTLRPLGTLSLGALLHWYPGVGMHMVEIKLMDRVLSAFITVLYGFLVFVMLHIQGPYNWSCAIKKTVITGLALALADGWSAAVRYAGTSAKRRRRPSRRRRPKALA